MDTKATILGSHAYFFRDGDAFTVPTGGTAGRNALPDDADPAWIDVGAIMEAGVEKKADEKEVWAPNPGKLALKDVLETKRDLTHKFTAQELSPFALEVIYGSEALNGTSTDFTALEGETKKGWLRIEQYDENDALTNTIYSYCHLKVAGEVKMGAELVSASFEARQLISPLNKGKLVATP
jgi:hypothetical protein